MFPAESYFSINGLVCYWLFSAELLVAGVAVGVISCSVFRVALSKKTSDRDETIDAVAAWASPSLRLGGRRRASL